MPVYELKCKCGESFEVVCPFDKRDAQPCPACGKAKAEPQVSRIVTERRFAGEESQSLKEGCHPRDVLAQRQLYGDTANISDEGDFSFDGRNQYKRFTKKKREADKLTKAIKPRRPARLDITP